MITSPPFSHTNIVSEQSRGTAATCGESRHRWRQFKWRGVLIIASVDIVCVSIMRRAENSGNIRIQRGKDSMGTCVSIIEPVKCNSKHGVGEATNWAMRIRKRCVQLPSSKDRIVTSAFSCTTTSSIIIRSLHRTDTYQQRRNQ